MQRTFRYFTLITALFVSVLLISNVASAAKIVNLGLPFLTFDAGTLLFPVGYIFGDVLVEVYGYRLSRRAIWAGFGSALLLSATLAIVRLLPGDAEWQASVGMAAFDGVLGTLASGRIVLASLLAYFAGEFSNAYVMARMKVRTQGRWLWLRTIASTLIGELLDSLIFVFVAFLGVWPLDLVVQIAISNYLFKCAVEALATPLTYRLVNFLKKTERVDHFDHDTNFNPFRLRATS